MNVSWTSQKTKNDLETFRKTNSKVCVINKILERLDLLLDRIVVLGHMLASSVYLNIYF